MSSEIPLRRLLTTFMVLFIVISGTLVYWQVGQSQSLIDSPYRRCISSEQPQRGRILDRNGIVLAWSEPDSASPCGWRRRYATAKHPSISSFLGYFSYVYGSTGLERYYDDVLTGKNNPTDFNDASNQFWNRTLHQTIYGADIYLSVDVTVQDKLDAIFTQQVTGGVCTSGSAKGSIIAEDPHTGQLLGVLSRPYYDGDKIGDTHPAPDNADMTIGQEYWHAIATNPDALLLNRALSGHYPPGSTMKTLTLIAALDSGKYTIDSTFSENDAKHFVVDGFHIDSNNLGDYARGPVPPSFPLDLAHAYAYSDNVVFARVGASIGPEIWLDYARRFSMATPDQPQAVQLDTAPLPVSFAYTRAPFGATDLAVTAYGQGQLLLTPMTMTMIAGAVAADGMLAQPHFLLKIVPHNSDPQTVPVVDLGQPQRVFSSQTAQGVRRAMRDVVTFGSVGTSGGVIAGVANSTTYIGAKTGTAQTGVDGAPHAWFISIAPDHEANNDGHALASVIMKEQGGEGACQAPIAQKLYEFALPLVGS